MPVLKYLDPNTGTYKPLQLGAVPPISTASGAGGSGTAANPITVQTAGTWGTAPLTTARFAGVQDYGDEIYVDSTGKLRSRPQLMYGTLTGTSLPSAYPNGVSVLTVNASNVGGGTGWPGNFYGAVETIKRMETSTAQDNGQAQQWFYRNNSGEVYYRWATNDSGGWSTWSRVSGTDDTGWVNITINSGFAGVASPSTPQCRRIGNVVYLRGQFSNTGIASVNDFTVGVIPAGYRPPTTGGNPMWLTFGSNAAAYYPSRWDIDPPTGNLRLRIGTLGNTYYVLDNSYLID